MIPRALKRRLDSLEQAKPPAEIPTAVFVDVPDKPDMALIGARLIEIPDGRGLLEEYADQPVKAYRGIDPAWI